MTIILFGIAGFLFVFFGFLQHKVDVRATRLARAQRNALVAREKALENVVHSANHQLSRELVLLGFAIDDLQDAELDVSSLIECYERIEAARDMVAVMARLGTDKSQLTLRSVTAEQLVPVAMDGIQFKATTVEPVIGDLALLRAACLLVAIYARDLGAGIVHIRSQPGLVQMVAPEFDKAAGRLALESLSDHMAHGHEQLGLIESILKKHQSTWGVEPSDAGLTLSIDVPMTYPDEIDLDQLHADRTKALDQVEGVR